MAKKATTPTTTELRRCIGSDRFGIEAHEAPVDDVPVQPSQKDGLGRMCRPHWAAYTNGLGKAALARKAAEAPQVELEPIAEPEAPATTQRGRREKAVAAEPETEVTEATAG